MEPFDVRRSRESAQIMMETLVRFTEEMTRLMERLNSAVETLHKYAWAIYQDAGCPYGHNRAGFKMWRAENAAHVGDIGKRVN